MLVFALEPQLSAEEFIHVLRRSTLAERRPVDDVERIETMLRLADIIVTARTSSGTATALRAGNWSAFRGP